MIRVLQTNKAYYPVVGGIETTFRNLCEGLSAERGMSVRALVCGSGSRWRDRNASVNGIPVRYAASLGTIFSMPISPSYVWRLAHAEADLVHVHSPFPLADIALLMSKQARYHHIVLTWHNDIVRQKRARALYLPLLRRFLDRVDRIAVGTPNNIPSSHILPEYAEKCDVIPYGIPLEWAQDMSAHAQEARALRERYGSPLVLFVGRLVYYKGIEYLIDAIAAVRDASLVIVGAGNQESKLREQIARLHLDKRVTILAPVPEGTLHALYQACDLFVLPSSEPTEGYGLVQIEAMACGKPVISTNLPTGVPYVNQHGNTGIIVPPKDSVALAEAIQRLLRDDSLRTTYGANARERAFREFTLQTMIARTLALYQRVLDPRRVTDAPAQKEHESTVRYSG